MANVQITSLPAAQPLTGSESVPIVQNGMTVQTTTGAIASSPVLNYPFLTVGLQTGLPSSRYFSTDANLTITDNGAQNSFVISVNGALAQLNSLANGFVVKTGVSTLVNRSIAVSGSGIAITNGDGIAGNPTVALNGLPLALANASGSGLLALNSSSSLSPVAILGVSNETSVQFGDAQGGYPTVGLADNAILPGNGGVLIPFGPTSTRPAGVDGILRYNTETGTFEGYTNGAWGAIVTGSGVTSVGTGNGLLGGPITSTGVITIDTTIVATLSDNQTLTNKSISGSNNTLTNIGNVSLANSTITINGNTVSLGGSTTVTASVTNSLTVGNGLQLNSGTTFDGSSAKTISINSSVVTLTDVQTLTNKTLVSPVFTNTWQLRTSTVPTYSPFSSAIASMATNTNGYQEIYGVNLNNGSDASFDFVAYNDASDVNSYFIDMGMNSSNFSSVSYPIFTANSGYVFTGGGTSGQASDFFLGTSNAASDLIFFTGDVLTTSIRARFKGNTGNFLIGTNTDTGYQLNVAGTTYFGGASLFGSTVTLNANPVSALQAATKQYVDSAVSTGFTVHTACRVATTPSFTTLISYNNGSSGVGATITKTAPFATLAIDGVSLSVNDRVLVKNASNSAWNGIYTVTDVGSAITAWVLTRATDFDQVGAGEIATNAYTYITAGSTNIGSSWILSQIATITIGTTALPFDLFSQPVAYTGTAPIDVTGQVISLTGIVDATHGGTGTGTVAVGDLLYGSATNTWSNLPLGIAYKSLVVNASGTQVEWNAVALNQTTAVSGQLNVSNGGTGVSTLTGLAYGNGSSAFTAATSSQVVSVIGSTAVTNATNAVNVGVTNDTTTAVAVYPTFVTANTGNLPVKVTSTKLSFIPSTGALTATGGISGGTF